MIKKLLNTFANALKLLLLILLIFYITGTVEYLPEYSSRTTIRLIDDLDHKTADIRKKSEKELRKRGKTIINELLYAFKNKNREIRQRVARLLGRLKDPRVVKPIVKALKRPDPNVRIDAIRVLSLMPNRCCTTALINTLTQVDQDRDVIHHASRVLSRRRDAAERLVHLLKTGNDDLKENVIEVIYQSTRYFLLDGDHRAYKPLIAFMEKEKNPFLQIAIIKTLKNTENQTVSRVLEQLLQHDNTEVCLSITRILKNISMDGVPGALLKNLNHHNPVIRAETVKALGEQQDATLIPIFGEMLKDKDWRVRYYTVRGLGKIKNELGVKFLGGLLKDSDPLIKRVSVFAMGETGHPSAIPFLATALEDEDNIVQSNSIYALGKIGKPAVETILEIIKTTGSKDIRRAATNALREIENDGSGKK